MWSRAIYDVRGASVIKYSFINDLEVLGSGYFVIMIVWTDIRFIKIWFCTSQLEMSFEKYRAFNKLKCGAKTSFLEMLLVSTEKGTGLWWERRF